MDKKKSNKEKGGSSLNNNDADVASSSVRLIHWRIYQKILYNLGTQPLKDLSIVTNHVIGPEWQRKAESSYQSFDGRTSNNEGQLPLLLPTVLHLTGADWVHDNQAPRLNSRDGDEGFQGDVEKNKCWNVSESCTVSLYSKENWAQKAGIRWQSEHSFLEVCFGKLLGKNIHQYEIESLIKCKQKPYKNPNRIKEKQHEFVDIIIQIIKQALLT